MKKKPTIIFVALLMICSSAAFAQKETKLNSFGFGIEIGSPTGNIKNLYSAAAGLTLRYSHHIGPGFITFTTGGLGYAPITSKGTPKRAAIQIPVRAGYKYIFDHHFFVMGELGYSYFKYFYNSNGDIASATRNALTFGASAGLNLNAFELGVRYGVNITNNDGGVIAARIGFNF